VTDPAREVSARITSAMGAVEECWMDLDGARMRYLRAGSGPALVLLHGLLGYSFSWRYTMPVLARYATVYAPDMLGTGFSDRVLGLDSHMRAAADRVLRFVQKLGVASFDLLGTSHGGAVAMMAAAACADGTPSPRLKRLVLVAPVNPYSPHGKRLAPFFGSSVGATLFRLTIARMTALYGYLLQRLYGDPKRIPKGTLEGYMAPLALPGLFDHALCIARSWTDDLRELESVLPKLRDIPTLLLWGSNDVAVYASSATRLREHFAHSRLVVFPGAGHLPYEEYPEEFNRAVIQFLYRDNQQNH
jgi:pimeloyl-ACP methyl ester carboxylesterase